ncbi:MAG TPA: hypothetical protein VIY69_08675 [Candidatus Acidoferrales bacterium]
MLPSDSVRVEYARSASADDINSLLYEADEEILFALLENPQFQEKHAELMASRVDVSSAVLSALAEAGKAKWMSSESLRVRLAQHPHSPKRIAMAAVRQLFLFDLVRLNLLPSAPPDIRRLAEETILGRVPHLPVGEKLTLARRGPARVAAAILAEGHPQAVKLALANRLLTESKVLKTLAKNGVNERVVVAIARHPKWSRLYNVRLALLRSTGAPLDCVQAFVGEVTLRDLTEIGKLHEISAEMRKLISLELERRKTKGQVSAVSDISGAA